jgi:hypothetical protein
MGVPLLGPSPRRIRPVACKGAAVFGFRLKLAALTSFIPSVFHCPRVLRFEFSRGVVASNSTQLSVAHTSTVHYAKPEGYFPIKSLLPVWIVEDA